MERMLNKTRLGVPMLLNVGAIERTIFSNRAQRALRVRGDMICTQSKSMVERRL